MKNKVKDRLFELWKSNEKKCYFCEELVHEINQIHSDNSEHINIKKYKTVIKGIFKFLNDQDGTQEASKNKADAGA